MTEEGRPELDPNAKAWDEPNEALASLYKRNGIIARANRLGKPRWLAMRIADFSVACEFGEAVFWERGSDYGDATKSTGLMGAVVTLVGDVAKIQGMVLDLENLERIANGDEELIERLEDALIDIHNYAAIAYHWLAQRNLLGDR